MGHNLAWRRHGAQAGMRGHSLAWRGRGSQPGMEGTRVTGAVSQPGMEGTQDTGWHRGDTKHGAQPGLGGHRSLRQCHSLTWRGHRAQPGMEGAVRSQWQCQPCHGTRTWHWPPARPGHCQGSGTARASLGIPRQGLSTLSGRVYPNFPPKAAHGILGWFGLEGTSKSLSFHGRDTLPCPRVLQPHPGWPWAPPGLEQPQLLWEFHARASHPSQGGIYPNIPPRPPSVTSNHVPPCTVTACPHPSFSQLPLSCSKATLRSSHPFSFSFLEFQVVSIGKDPLGPSFPQTSGDTQSSQCWDQLFLL